VPTSAPIKEAVEKVHETKARSHREAGGETLPSSLNLTPATSSACRITVSVAGFAFFPFSNRMTVREIFAAAIRGMIERGISSSEIASAMESELRELALKA